MANPADDGVDVIMEEDNNSSASELEDDDYDLIEENLGVKVQRKKFRRLRRISDDSEDETGHGQGDDREAIAQHLFEGSDNEEDYCENAIEVAARQARRDHYSSESEDDYSETDDFIVDDEGQPINENSRQRKRKRNVPDAVVQEAQDIFGAGFNYAEFEKYGNDDEQDEDGNDYEDESDQQRCQRKKLKKPTKSIHELYEPYELERAGYTEEDIKIRKEDVPERFQLRFVPVESAQEDELDEEAEWIVRQCKFQGVFENGIPLQPSEATTTAPNTNWADEEDWDKNTNVGERNAIPLKSSVVPPAPNTNWGDEEDWDKNTTVGERNALPLKSSVVPPAPNTNWGDEEDWDKNTSVGEESFFNFKRPALPQPLRDRSESTRENAVVVDDNWAEESWETRTTVQQPSYTSVEEIPAPSLSSIIESAPIIVSPPLPENQNKPEVVEKVRNTLTDIRNNLFEVPYIAFYRKEKVIPELSLNDLWKIYRLDGQFCQLKKGKENLHKLFSNMKEYLTERMTYQESVESEMDYIRMISEDHLDRIKEIKSVDELKDNRDYFKVHYADVIPDMKFYLKEMERLQNGGAVEVDPMTDKASIYDIKRKRGATSRYIKCRRIGFSCSFLQKIGITSEKFAENLRDNYQRHEVEQWPISPTDTAIEIIEGNTLKSQPEHVLQTAQFLMAVEIASEPIVRQCVRKEFFARATINCCPTKQGLRDIDESHPCFTMKYLKDKPVKTLKNDQFLKLTMAEKDELVTISLGENFDYFEKIKQLIHRDEFSKTVQEWNDLREQCLKQALEKYLIPELRKELREKLLEECYEYILDQCSSNLYQWLEVAPMKVSYPDENEVEWETTREGGIRVLAMTYDTAIDFSAVTVASIRPDGEPDIRSYRNGEEPSDRLKLKNMLRINCEEKVEDMDLLKDYIRDMKPHIIIIAGQSREAIHLRSDVTRIVNDLVTDDGFPEIKIEIVDNEAAKVYASSARSLVDLGSDYTMLARQAISLGRGVQDPLLELAQLCNADEDILCLKFHPLQDQVPKERLKERLEIEFINRTCEVGVDVNRALAFPHTASVLQFVCGLGPRKASALLQKLRQTSRRVLENREHLVTNGFMAGKVQLNCAGFIKIDGSAFEDFAESYVEVLDGTRVHPMSYEYARRIAFDALYDDTQEEAANANFRSAVEEVLENPEPDKLNALNLVEYAKCLMEKGEGARLYTLNSILEELKAKYKDRRVEYTSPDPEKLFHILTKETPDTLNVGKLVTAVVAGILRKKPKEDEHIEPIRIHTTGKWQCPYCGKNEFPELSDVWAHLDHATACPGPAVGVRVYLENGLPGFIPISRLSDKTVLRPEDRVYEKQKIHCRITKIIADRLSVECTSRSSDLLDERNEWKPEKDKFYDTERESFELDRMKEEEEKKKVLQNRQVYVKRVIVHPSFRNVDFKEAEKLMKNMEQGEVIVRPSSKAANRLTVTWKVANGISQHIDVREEGKASAFSLGQSLWIGDDEFEDIDEIIARHVTPMAGYARDIINYKYYVADLDGNRQRAEDYLQLQKEKSNNKIHYIFHTSPEYPGKFLLSYLPKNSAMHEFVTVTTDGFRFRQQIFENLDELLKWFKTHYKDPPPTPTSY